MNSFSPGFKGRGRHLADRLPPGQYATEQFPMLSAGPTPNISTATWAFTVTTELGEIHSWTWESMLALPQQETVQDIHCVTRWSKFDTRWRGVPLDAFFEDVETAADFVVVSSYGGTPPISRWRTSSTAGPGSPTPTTASRCPPEHGGPARLLVPHLYFWKSAKWVRGLRLTHEDEPGFWESVGYHSYGDPWREQRNWGD
ncbi:molybdopterin-dependent oxidoreductase [Streptomyces sp. NPDC059862]|uniref:molybdopterin-dependent oxidoreductase n=1 Tax=Streptomyces sp. NPDC059862 TaxID=3346975 RepID=UPI003664EB1C